MADQPEVVYDHFDDVTQVGPMIDNLHGINNFILSPEFQNEMVHYLTDAENASVPDIHDPFGLTQAIEPPAKALNLDDEVVEIDRACKPTAEALFRVNFFSAQFASWLFTSTEAITPESIKRVLEKMVQNTPLPHGLLRTDPDVDQMMTHQKIKACLEFARQVDTSKVFLPCEIVPVIATEAFNLYQQLKEKYREHPVVVLGDSDTVIMGEFIHEFVGVVMLEAIQVSVDRGKLVVSSPDGALFSSEELVSAMEGLAQESLRGTMQREGKKGLSAETVRLVLTSFNKNLSAFNSYVEFLDDNPPEGAPDSDEAKEQARTLLCSYVWALWHVSGTSVLEAEQHLEVHNIELTTQRKEDLMIMKLLDLAFDDFKQPWSVISKKIRANRNWIKTYENPQETRDLLVRKFQALKKAQKQINDNLELKGLVEQQQALAIESTRLKKVDRDWQTLERQGGLEARVKMVLSESAHLRTRDVAFFDLLAEIVDLHPQCKVPIRSDISDEDLKEILNVLREQPFEDILKSRLTAVENQLRETVGLIAAKMPAGIVSYQHLESEFKNIEKEIQLAEFVYGIKLGKAFDPDQAGVNLKTNKDAFTNRMKELHGEREALQRQREKQASAPAVEEKVQEDGSED